MDRTSLSYYEIDSKIVQELFRLTHDEKLNWKRDEEGVFYAEYNGIKANVEQYNFQRMNDQSSDNTMLCISVSVPSEGENVVDNLLRFDYSIGTELYSLIMEMISISYKEWNDSYENGLDKGSKMLTYLSSL